MENYIKINFGDSFIFFNNFIRVIKYLNNSVSPLITNNYGVVNPDIDYNCYIYKNNGEAKVEISISFFLLITCILFNISIIFLCNKIKIIKSLR